MAISEMDGLSPFSDLYYGTTNPTQSRNCGDNFRNSFLFPPDTRHTAQLRKSGIFLQNSVYLIFFCFPPFFRVMIYVSIYFIIMSVMCKIVFLRGRLDATRASGTRTVLVLKGSGTQSCAQIVRTFFMKRSSRTRKWHQDQEGAK